MRHIRNDKTSRQRRRASATLVLAAATAGLLAAAMAGSPTARADNPYIDIVNDVQNSITRAEADYSAAATYFATAGETHEGLIASVFGFDHLFVSPADYTLLGLTAAGTGTDFSGDGSVFDLSQVAFSLSAAGEQADALGFLNDASLYSAAATTAFSAGEYFSGVEDSLLAGYSDLLAGQADTLAGLFSAGI